MLAPPTTTRATREAAARPRPCALPWCGAPGEPYLCMAHWRELPATLQRRIADSWDEEDRAPRDVGVCELITALEARRWLRDEGEARR